MLTLAGITTPIDRPILCDISIAFEPGTVTLVSGESGAGKTTLLHLINGIVPHAVPFSLHGQVRLGALNLNDVSIEARSRHIATVLQNPKTQFYAIESDDEMAFALENRNVPAPEIHERIANVTRALHMESLRHRHLNTLSGGESQLVAIASVAIMDSEILLFDEPSASLDGAHMAAFRRVLMTLKAAGKTLIIAEHRLHDLADLIDRLIVLEDKKAYVYDASELNDDVVARHHLRALTLRAMADDTSHAASDDACLVGQNIVLPYDRAHRRRSFACPYGLSYLVGANGSGKTSLLLRLAGLSRGPGRVLWHGVPFTKAITRTAMVFQQAGVQLFADTVDHELALIESDVALRRETLEAFGLGDHLDHHPLSLSGGEKQRLALAKALRSKRELILLDEPTSGLGRSYMERFANDIKRFATNAQAIIIATHDDELRRVLPAPVIRMETMTKA